MHNIPSKVRRLNAIIRAKKGIHDNGIPGVTNDFIGSVVTDRVTRKMPAKPKQNGLFLRLHGAIASEHKQQSHSDIE